MTRLPLVLAFACAAASLQAQCNTVWSSGGPQPELTGGGKCSITWDPDGAGPAPQRLVIGGRWLRAGAEPLDQLVMTWDGSVWQSLGPGPGTSFSGTVDALAVWNGTLVAGGSFFGGGINFVASWNGSAWQPLGPGVPGTVHALAVWNGDLVAVGTNTAPFVHKWNGVAWTALPTPPLLQSPRAVTSFQGLLCIGGYNPGSTTTGVLERWNGTSWLPSITANGAIRCLAVRSISLTLSSLYVGGNFTSIGGTAASRIAITSGGTAFSWQQVGNGLSLPCTHLNVRAILAGTAVVVCVETGALTQSVMQLSGSSFVSMGSASLTSVSFYDGSYHGTSDAGGPACSRYAGTAWVPVRGPGLVGGVFALTRNGGDVIVGGSFSVISGVALNHIARWDGTTLMPLGSGMQGSAVRAVLTLDNGDVVAGGEFAAAGGVPANNVARWNGSTWSPLGSGVDASVRALCRMPNGDVVAGGSFATAGGVPCARIARWNGTAWLPLGTGMNADVNALALRGNGDLVAAGAFTDAGGTSCNRVAQWNGTAWLQLGSGLNGVVRGLAVRPNDDVVVVGFFSAAGGFAADRCARWNGIAWSSTGAATSDIAAVNAVHALPNGDVIAGRGFHQPAAFIDEGISRWNGVTWSGIGSGLAVDPSPNSVVVNAIVQRSNGDVIVGGSFHVAGGLLSPGLAVLSATCPATAQAYGAGCNSAAGTLVLVADTLPWLGATFRSATTGIAPLSLCLGVTGFTQLSIPLQSLLGAGQPGCTLLVSPDITELLPQDGAGVARGALAIPPSPSLVGAQFFQQSAILEFTGLLTLVALRSSNALALTIGAL